MTSDEDELVEGIRKGDTRSCNTLVKTYWTDLNFLARRIIGSPDEADDITQDAFINAIKHIDTFENRGNLRAWLRKIVTNQALMALRKKKALKEDSLDDLMLQFDDSGHHLNHFTERPANLDVLAESSQVRERIRQAIDNLPDNYRLTLILRDIQGYTTREVADMTHTTEKNVKVRLHRARLALRNLLGAAFRDTY
ncbi:MAG: RNA polymerase sigma factor [Gammaproteobacteria bacterium]